MSWCRAGLWLVALSAVTACLGLPAAGAASATAARPLRTYAPAGTAVHGTSSPAGAPALKPGQYTDSLRPDQEKSYTVSLADGVSPYLAVTLIRPPGIIRAGQPSGDYVIFSDDVTVKLGTAAGTDCGDVDVSTSQDRLVTAASVVALPGRVGTTWTGAFSGSGNGECGKPGKYVVTVSRTQSSDRIPSTNLPIEIVFIAEPPLDEDVTNLPRPQPASSTALAPDITAAPRAVTAGGSYGTAAALGGSGSYTDTIRPGETLFYRVRLAWGQRLGYTVRLHGKKGIDEIYSFGSRLSTPFRQDIAGSDDSGSYSDTSDEKVTGQTAVPVAYRNRESDAEAVQPLRLAGYYYLVVSMENGRTSTAAEIPMDIAVRVEGKAQPAPKYRNGVPDASDPGSLGLPGQQSSGRRLLVRVGYVAGGALALALAALVLLLPVFRRRGAGR